MMKTVDNPEGIPFDFSDVFRKNLADNLASYISMWHLAHSISSAVTGLKFTKVQSKIGGIKA